MHAFVHTIRSFSVRGKFGIGTCYSLHVSTEMITSVYPRGGRGWGRWMENKTWTMRGWHGEYTHTICTTLSKSLKKKILLNLKFHSKERPCAVHCFNRLLLLLWTVTCMYLLVCWSSILLECYCFFPLFLKVRMALCQLYIRRDFNDMVYPVICVHSEALFAAVYTNIWWRTTQLIVIYLLCSQFEIFN
jgi:hypothetical protein